MALVFALAVTARVVYFLVLSPTSPEWSPEVLPRDGWLTIATNLARGHGYSTNSLLTYFPVDRLVPTAARSPVPVLLLAALVRLAGSHWYYPALLFSWCCSGLVAIAAYWIAVRASGRHFLGLWTGVVFAVYLSEMYITTTFAVASEPIFSALLAAYLVLSIRAVDRCSVPISTSAGAALALASLSRPAVLLLPVVPIAWMLYRLRRQAVAMVVGLSLTFAVIHVPWIVRNYAMFGRPIVTTTLGGFVLYRHNAKIEKSQYDLGYSLSSFVPMVRNFVATTGRPLQSYDEPELNDLLSAEGLRIIRAHPWRYLKLSAYRTIWIWYADNSGRGLYAVENAAIYLLALVGLWYAVRAREPIYGLLLLNIAYFVAVYSALNVQYRYICPVMPLMILIAGLPVDAWVARTRRGGQSGAPRAASMQSNA